MLQYTQVSFIVKKILCLIALCTSLSLPAFSFFEFSGSAGIGLYFGKETVGMENTIMEHSAVGAVANFYAITPINLGLWLRFAYMVPYRYSIQDLTNPEYSSVADLTYIFTQFLDFSAGVAYIVKFNDYFSLPIAFGFNFLQNILSPRISYTYGLAVDVAIRATIARAISISLGATGAFGFSMDFISQGLQYKTDYSLISITPYLSVGFVGKPPPKNAPSYESSRATSSYYDDYSDDFDPDYGASVSDGGGSDAESMIRLMLVRKIREKIGSTPVGDGSSGKVLEAMPSVTPGSAVVTEPVAEEPVAPPVPEPPKENVISDAAQSRIAQFKAIFDKDRIGNVTMTEINGNFVMYLEDFKFLPNAGLTVAEIKRIKAVSDCLRPLRNAKIRVISHINLDASVEAQMLESVARAQEVEKKLIAFYAVDKKRIVSGASNTIPNRELGNCIEIVITKGTF